MPPEVNLFTSVSGSGFLNSWSKHLERDGFKVRIVSALEDARYRDMGPLQRFSSFWKRSFGQTRLMRRIQAVSTPGSVNIVTTNPFWAPAAALRVHNSQRIVTWFLDLYPECLRAGGVPFASLLSPPIARLTTRALQESAASVFMGKRIEARCHSRYGKPPLGAVIPFGAADDLLDMARPLSGQLRLLYSGHLGRLHDWSTLAEGIKLLLPAGLGIEVRFHASGSGYLKLQRVLAPFCPHPALSLLGPLKDSDWRAAMAAADIGIVTMLPGAENVLLPSKVFSAMAAGQAILGICPFDSDLADIVVEHDAGWIVQPGDPLQLVKIIEMVRLNPVLLSEKQQNARRAAREQFCAAKLARAWTDLLNAIAPGLSRND